MKCKTHAFFISTKIKRVPLISTLNQLGMTIDQYTQKKKKKRSLIRNQLRMTVDQYTQYIFMYALM